MSRLDTFQNLFVGFVSRGKPFNKFGINESEFEYELRVKHCNVNFYESSNVFVLDWQCQEPCESHVMFDKEISRCFKSILGNCKLYVHLYDRDSYYYHDYELTI